MKLLKFDTLYPLNYIQSKTEPIKHEVRKMTFQEYHDWLIGLRMNFSDFYTYNLAAHGWDAKEIILDNKLYKEKIGKHYLGNKFYFLKLANKLWNYFSWENRPFIETVIKKVIEKEKPDVIFVREHSTIRSSFWEQFKSDALLVCRMDCNLPKNWSPLSFDLIYTNIPYYRDFFESNLIPTKSNSNGFDSRLNDIIQVQDKIYDVIYIGGLGDTLFTERTRFFENILETSKGKFNFKWWGYKLGDFDNTYPNLSQTYVGPIGGLEMFRIMSQAKIVLNYYEIKESKNSYNQRLFEVMGVGAMLLARNSETFLNWENYLVTYEDISDCTKQIEYYLKNDIERENIAKEGKRFVLQNFNYYKLMEMLGDELKEAYGNKFSKS